MIVFDVWPGSEAPFRESSRASGGGWLIPPPNDTFGIREAADLAWVRTLLTPHPLKTYQDRVRLRGRPGRIPAAAVICVGGDPADVIPVDGAMPSLRITAGHDAMISDPEILTDALLRVAEGF